MSATYVFSFIWLNRAFFAHLMEIIVQNKKNFERLKGGGGQKNGKIIAERKVKDVCKEIVCAD